MNDAKQSLEDLLESLGESSQFVTAGSSTPVLPGLELKGVGSIGTPVSTADAKRLITKAIQAPYGRGEDTIVDPKVRRVWQLEPSQFALRNPGWSAHVNAIVDAIRQEFGIRQKVSAHLYKLLVYEKGSFFAPHRDSEKAPGMFATLVVGLPSRHEGGSLIVEHDGKTKTIDFGGKNAEFKTQYAAFYSDCQHKITPVTAGYRVCLVYNLAIAGKKQPSAPRNSSSVEKAAQLLRELFAEPSGNLSRIAIPFKHQYTEAGLDPQQLKGPDRARADVLVRAAESLEYQCYFALLTLYESGEADYSTLDYDPYRSRRSHRWSYDDDQDDDDEGDDDSEDSGVEMEEVYENERSLEHWLDTRGRKQAFGKMHLEEGEILGLDGKEEWSRRQEVHEATGNEGVSLERWYHQGVIVIWPPENYFGIWAREGQASAIPALEKLAVRAKKSAALESCRGFAGEIIGRWKPRQIPTDGAGSYSARMLKLLERIGTPELVQRFLNDVFPTDFDGSEGKALGRIGRQFGWKTLGAPIRDFLARQKPEDYHTQLGHIVSICENLCCDPPALTKERQAVCASFADGLVQVLDRWDEQPAKSWYYKEEVPERAGVVASVVHIFEAIQAPRHLDRFLTHALDDKRNYGLHEVLIPDVKAIQKWLPKVPAAHSSFSRLLDHCLAELRTATAQPVEPPQDWSRDAALGCKCEDCGALSRFLRDPTLRVARFPLRKDRRQHLHQQIDKHKCDCTHVTDRKGSPQTLVCTKTRASYERRLKQYEIDNKLMAELQAMKGSKRSAAAKKPSSRTSKR
jgi:predicted 2-oxoglutarate/Fe(II)-dependent dioxygenase YbiX